MSVHWSGCVHVCTLIRMCLRLYVDQDVFKAVCRSGCVQGCIRMCLRLYVDQDVFRAVCRSGCVQGCIRMCLKLYIDQDVFRAVCRSGCVQGCMSIRMCLKLYVDQDVFKLYSDQDVFKSEHWSGCIQGCTLIGMCLKLFIDQDVLIRMCCMLIRMCWRNKACMNPEMPWFILHCFSLAQSILLWKLVLEFLILIFIIHTGKFLSYQASQIPDFKCV